LVRIASERYSGTDDAAINLAAPAPITGTSN